MKLKISLIAIAILGSGICANAQTIKQTQITPITEALKTVIKLDPITFSYDQSWADKLKMHNIQQNGFDIAALLKIAPQLVINQQRNYTEGKNNNKTAIVQLVDYQALIPLLVASIKEQQLQIDKLKAEVNALKSK